MRSCKTDTTLQLALDTTIYCLLLPLLPILEIITDKIIISPSFVLILFHSSLFSHFSYFTIFFFLMEKQCSIVLSIKLQRSLRLYSFSSRFEIVYFAYTVYANFAIRQFCFVVIVKFIEVSYICLLTDTF